MSPAQHSTTAAEAAEFISAFLGSWRDRNLDFIMSFFAHDAVYHNVPVKALAGTEAIRGIFKAFLGAFSSASLDVVTLVAEPDLVMAERIDRFVLNDGRKVELPVTGVFVIRDRKIVRFSDYFDLADFERQSGMKL